MKHLKVFENENEFQSAEKITPRVSLIRNSGVLYYEMSNSATGDYPAGTILMMNLTGEQEWLSLNEYKEKEASLKSQGFHVVGVVVVPASHTDDNTYRIVGVEKIKSNDGIFGQQSYDSDYFDVDNNNYYSGVALVNHTHNTDYAPAYNAEFGSEQNVIYQDIYELRENNILDYRSPYDYEVVYNVPTFATDYEADVYYDYPGDYTEDGADYIYPIEKIQNPYDTKTFWHTQDYTSKRGQFEYDYDPSWAEADEEHYLMPSPYLNNGLKNELYHSGGKNNALSDMNGKENTESIYQDLVMYAPYNTDNLYINTYQYKTETTTQGDWYVPSFGEVGYLVARAKDIIESIKYINPDIVFDLESKTPEYADGGEYEYQEYNEDYERHETIFGELVSSTFYAGGDYGISDDDGQTVMYTTSLGFTGVIGDMETDFPGWGNNADDDLSTPHYSLPFIKIAKKE